MPPFLDQWLAATRTARYPYLPPYLNIGFFVWRCSNLNFKDSIVITPDRIRTCDLRIRNPLSKSHKPLPEQSLTENTKKDYAQISLLLSEKDNDLAQIVKCWPNLPGNIKITIKTLIETAGK
jgi:hypothetical protein